MDIDVLLRGEYPGRRGLLGADDSGIGITRQAEAVGAHDWPTGFVFHILPDRLRVRIPVISFLRM